MILMSVCCCPLQFHHNATASSLSFALNQHSFASVSLCTTQPSPAQPCDSHPSLLALQPHNFEIVRVLMQGTGKGQNLRPGEVKNFLFSTSSRPVLGPIQPPIQWVPGAISRGIKRPGREADHSPPTSAKVKKMWIYTSPPPYAFMA
jgi:hypothetical protein